MSELDKIKQLMSLWINSKHRLAQMASTTIYPATGETHSCYRPPVNLRELKNNPGVAQHNRKESTT